MSITGYDFQFFAKKVNEILTLSVPVRTPERLFGRDHQLEVIQLALHAEGRHVFIYGDRGVGKTSLAHTAANLVQSSDNKPIYVSCDPESTLESIIESIYYQGIGNMPKSKYKSTTTLGINIPGIKAETSLSEREEQKRPIINNIPSAVAALDFLGKKYSQKTVIVIDEFDLISNDEQRAKFGILLKQLSDGEVKVKIIFTGIGQSVTDLIGGHLSSQRQLEQIELERLNWTGRKLIITSAFEYFNIDIPSDISDRICALSDGFPYYVHLMCNKLLHECFKSKDTITQVNKELFLASLNAAVMSVEESLKQSYDMATSRDEHMHYILWAMAEGADLTRELDHIIASYVIVMNKLNQPNLSLEEFKKRFTKLRKDNHGSIITHALRGRSGVRPGWFCFRENMIRGFIRMHAEKCGIVLDFERHYSAITANIRTAAVRGYYDPLNTVERKVAILRKDDEKENNDDQNNI
ncbi:ATP-binding protein [Photorhabdus sp. RM71S]|uniref:ATP-binding protein n=1 Tax=Photorhabdus sp. RM71S TaxID=3342824 RepID=UPI0036DADB8B